MVVSVVLQPYDPLIRVDRVDDSDEEEEQAQERLHATEVEWRMITISDYTAAFVYLNVCICASSLKLFLKVSTWFPMTEKQLYGSFTFLRKGWSWFQILTDWMMISQTKSLFYKEWRQFKEWDDNGHWCTKVRWRGEVDVNELENRGRSVSVCPLSAFARMMCGPRIRMGKREFRKKYILCPSYTSP